MDFGRLLYECGIAHLFSGTSLCGALFVYGFLPGSLNNRVGYGIWDIGLLFLFYRGILI